MSQTITIDPVTRLEGHGKITIQLNGQGEVEDAHFHVTQVRGFERFSEGRPFYEMPSLMARICGICPVSHLLASAKACEAIMSVRIPHTAAQLRRMLNLAQMVQSHALSFFHLSSPDLLLGMESDPATRNILGVAAAKPELGRAGIGLRRFGQHIIELLGDKRIHPGWVVPGGVTEPLDAAKRDEILAMLPEAYANVGLALDAYKQIADKFKPEIEVFANFPSNYLGLVNEDESIEIHRRRAAADRRQGQHDRRRHDRQPLHRSDRRGGRALQLHQVRLLQAARLSRGQLSRGPAGAAQHRRRPWARRRRTRNWPSSSSWPSGPVESSFHYHHARLVEMLYGIEKIEQILADPLILDKHVRATAGVNRLEGAGQIEAPRGTLNHHYKVDENGKITWANLVVATGHNNNAMNRGVLQAAKALREGRQVHRGRAEPRRGRGPHLRSVPELLHARLRPDAAGGTLVNADGEVMDRVVRG